MQQFRNALSAQKRDSAANKICSHKQSRTLSLGQASNRWFLEMDNFGSRLRSPINPLHLFCAIVFMLPVGCHDELEDRKREITKTFFSQLSVCLETEVLNLRGNVKSDSLIEVQVADFKLALPPYQEIESTDKYLRLKYDDYVVTFVPEIDDSGLNETGAIWGECDLDRYRKIFSLSRKDIVDAVSDQALVHIVSGLTLKTYLVPAGATQRFCEFRTGAFRGFLAGSTSSKSEAEKETVLGPDGRPQQQNKKRLLFYQCFEIRNKRTKMLTIVIDPKGLENADDLFDRYIASIRVTASSSSGPKK